MKHGSMKNSIFSFEFLLALYLFAGIYKAAPRFNFVPIDLTAILAVLSVSSAGYVLYKNDYTIQTTRPTVIIVSLFSILVAYAAVSLTWSTSNNYALMKLFEIAVLTGWPLAATALIIGPSSRRRKRFFVCLALLAAWFVFEILISQWVLNVRSGVTPFGTDNYISISRAIGIGVLIASVKLLNDPKGNLRAVWVLFVAFGSLSMWLTGARGPLVALAGATAILAAVYIIKTFDRHVQLRRIIELIGLHTVVLAIGVVTGMRTARRLSELAGVSMLLPSINSKEINRSESGGESVDVGASSVDEPASTAVADAVGDSAANRLDYYSAALDLIQSSPIIGHGLGSFESLTEFADVRYPHNIILEAGSELGLLGLLLVCSLLIYPFGILFQRIRVSREFPVHAVLVLVLICYTGANAMVSGDLGTNRQLFTMVGLVGAGISGK